MHANSPGTTSALPVGAIHELPLQFRMDLVLPSVFRGWINYSPSPGTTSVPLRPFGGTCLSGPLIPVGSSLAFPRGLKSLAESGAKAPHSMECGDSSPLFREGFSLHRPAQRLGGAEGQKAANWLSF